MKSRRHRAIDKADKQVSMIAFIHKKKDRKEVKKNLREIDRDYHLTMKRILKTEEDIFRYYGVWNLK